MSQLKFLLLVAVLAIFSVNANLNAIELVEQREVYKRQRVRDVLGCCVYRSRVWESSTDVLETNNYKMFGCTPPGVFELRRSCYYSVTYDPKLKLFSLTSSSLHTDLFGPTGMECNRDGTNRLNCQDRPRSFTEASNAVRWFKYVRQIYFHSEPQCIYNGNEDKPTCHNISNAGEITKIPKCIHIYDPITQKYKFANKTCEGAQELVTWPKDKDGCFRHNNSWEYTCVGGEGNVDHSENIKKALLPLTPVGCCSHANFKSSYSSGCDAASFMRVQPLSNTRCHLITQYHDEKKGNTDEVTVLVTYSNQDGFGSEATCGMAPVSKDFFHCQCPVSNLTMSHSYMKHIHETTVAVWSLDAVHKKIEYEDQFRCCVLRNLSTNDLSQWKQECLDNFDRKLTQSKPNGSCHYILEKKSTTEAIKVILTYKQYNDEQIVSCTPITESGQQYHCQCPSSNIYGRQSNTVEVCLNGMFDQMKAFKVILPQTCNQINNLPPQHQFCCDYTNILSNNTLSASCSDDKQVKVDSNVTCQYIIDKKSRNEPAVVLQMFQQEGVESTTTCIPVLNTDQLYKCGCPPTIPQGFSYCLKNMFHLVDTIVQAKPQKFCCNYANILSTQISTVPIECDSESWKQVDSNADCHYVLEKISTSDPIKVLLLIFNGVKVESSISCKPIDKAIGQYHCHCAATSDRYSNGCLKAMFKMTEEVFNRTSMAH